MWRAAAAAFATAALLVGAAAAAADSGPPPPPPPPPNTGGGGSSTGSGTSSGGPSQAADTKPPPRATGLRADVSKPGRILLTWALIHRADVASVFVERGPAAHCPTAPVPSRGFYAGTTIGDLAPRARQVDADERDTKSYCYAVFTLDAAGNWARPVTRVARNPGDRTPPAAVTTVTAAFGQGGAVRLTWANPPDAAHDVVVRGPGSTCPQFETDGTRVGTRRLRQSQVDTTVQTAGTYCYGVFASDAAGNVSPVATATVEPAQPATTTSSASPPPSQPGSSSSSLPGAVGLIGGGALLVAALAYATLRILRREWEWHARTGYGIRDLVSIDVRDYSLLGLVIPGIIAVCIAGVALVLLLSL